MTRDKTETETLTFTSIRDVMAALDECANTFFTAKAFDDACYDVLHACTPNALGDRLHITRAEADTIMHRAAERSWLAKWWLLSSLKQSAVERGW